MYDCVFITAPGICRMLYEVIFPWIFCFAIIFGLLIRSKIFGTDTNDQTNRGVSAIIGLVAGFLIVMGFGPSMGIFLASVSASTVMFLAVVMGIILVITMINPGFVYGGGEGKVTWKSAGIIGLIIVVAWLIISGSGSGLGWYSWYSIQQDLLALAIVIIVIGLMMWFVMGSTGGGAAPSGNEKQQT